MRLLLISLLSWTVLMIQPVSITVASEADNGVVTLPSEYDVATTIDRLENLLRGKGVTIVTRWRHDERANAVDIPLRPTELLIFGNPKLGSHLMTSQQTVGIDLPLKALAWEDADGKVWISYNDPAYITARHGITDREPIKNKMASVISTLISKAIAQ